MRLSKFFSNFDFLIFISTILLTVIGIFFIYSANYNKTGDIKIEYQKQIAFLIISIIFFMIPFLFIPSRNIQNYSILFYIVCFIGLFVTLLFPEVMGQRRVNILGLSLQISEFMKIATILLVSNYYSKKTKEELKNVFVYLIACAIVISPVLVILLQPDLGTSLVYFPILLVISYMAGVKKRYILYTLLLIFFTSFIPVVTTVNKLFYNNENIIINLLLNMKYVIMLLFTLLITFVLSILVYYEVIKGISIKFRKFFYWYMFFCSVALIGLSFSYPVNKILKPYQKDRLLIFFNPYVDEKGTGYHIIQSMTTVGNGGLVGKGWKKGEQVQKFFLPEQATDFIYPVIAEEKGFLGSSIIILLYFLIFYRGIRICFQSRDYWGLFVTSGILTMLLFHILENIGMCVGIMPITGIPLPFLSYGGSFLFACYMGIGIIMNIGLNKYQY